MKAGMSEPAVLVTMRGIVKEFPGVRANDHVDFSLRPGEVHAILGENGAGKTTLMNVLAGIHSPDDGEIAIRGETVELPSPKQAIDCGIGMVHQHFKLVGRFTVAENVTLGWHSPRTLIRPRPLEREISRLAETYGFRVDPSRSVWQLTVGEQQRVEILKNLYRRADVLILDEPTAVLAPQEATALFASLRQMAEEGRGVVLITHKLDEVMAAADRVTVLRAGRNVATLATSETTRQRAHAVDDRRGDSSATRRSPRKVDRGTSAQRRGPRGRRRARRACAPGRRPRGAPRGDRRPGGRRRKRPARARRGGRRSAAGKRRPGAVPR